jgi:hypothetical protein
MCGYDRHSFAHSPDRSMRKSMMWQRSVGFPPVVVRQDIEPTGAGSVKKTMVSEVWRGPSDRMVMLFDYGDDWRFTVVLKAWGMVDKTRKYPVILEKKGRAPRQYA